MAQSSLYSVGLSQLAQAPGKNCPTYVVGVNEGDYDAEKDTVVSNASCTTNGMASVCKVLDESFGVGLSCPRSCDL